MKLKKFLSIACASVMVLSLAACAGKGGSKTAASVDFEDGKFGFVLMNTDVKTADASVLSVKDVNGSKVLFAENQGNAVTKIGVDLTALLGDDVAKLATIDFQLGTSADKFAACSGKVFGNFGEKTNVDLGNFSVYMADKNPIDVSLKVSDLKAGEKNYIVISRSEDLGATPSSMFIDNIVLKDADGKVLKANTDGKFDAPEGYAVDWSQVTGDSVAFSDGLPDGSWPLMTTIIEPSLLEAYTEKGAKITYTMMFDASCDNICFKPATPDWVAVNDIADADGNPAGGFGNFTGEDCPEDVHGWHLKLDGVFHTSDNTKTELVITFAPETIKAIIEHGGLTAQINGCVATSALIEQPAETVTVDRSNVVEMPACYPGDWGGVNSGLVVPFENLAVGAEIVVDILPIDAAKFADAWKICPFNADGWTKLTKFVTDASVAVTEGGGDESFFEPTLDDTQIKFTVSQDLYDAIKASVDANADGWGGLGFQVFGVGVTKVTVNGEAVFEFVASEGGEEAEVPEGYPGDWSAYEFTETVAAGNKVTLDVTIMNDAAHEYWLITPIDVSWAKIPDQAGDLSVGLNDAGDFFQCDAETTQITFTVTEDLAANIWGFQTFGVAVTNVTVE